MNGAVTRHRAVTLGLLAAVLVGTAASSSGAPGFRPDRANRDLDLAASANPTAAEPVVADDAFSSDAVWRRATVKSTVTAIGSAICDGCNAASTALQVFYVSRGQEARLDNTAAAWTQSCQDCMATALSVQVVVLTGVTTIVPNNRALAVNAACASCQAAGEAYQVVVSSPTSERLSKDEVAELRMWVAKQNEALRGATTNSLPPATTNGLDGRQAERRAQKAAVSALGDLEDMVTGDLDATVVSSDVEVNL
jgi:hypothetical protein